MFKKIMKLDIIKKAFAYVPFFFQNHNFPFKLFNVPVHDIVINNFFLIASK